MLGLFEFLNTSSPDKIHEFFKHLNFLPEVTQNSLNRINITEINTKTPPMKVILVLGFNATAKHIKKINIAVKKELNSTTKAFQKE